MVDMYGCSFDNPAPRAAGDAIAVLIERRYRGVGERGRKISGAGGDERQDEAAVGGIGSRTREDQGLGGAAAIDRAAECGQERR
jgi:hypothetical protein